MHWTGVFLVLMFASGLLVRSNSLPESQLYTTRTGEMRSIHLADGSVVHLNTRTRLEWFGEADSRRAVLHEGEAFFEVASDAARPFRVEVANSEIRVPGTRFNVYRRKHGQVSIAVLDGTVQVEGRPRRLGHTAWRRELSANQCMRYGPEGLIRDVHTSPRVPYAVMWRERLLVIADKPLPEVLDELSRYTDQRIVVRDSRLNEMRVGGTVRTTDVRAALLRLGKVAPITVSEHRGTFTLDYRRQ